ncbi:MAG: hypothetical protein EP330_20385 [Deltaproteobacteria bacterium]|nr:MAG: hypothetical protein EP330_20385 [Deltaproteobacteria bacterium]
MRRVLGLALLAACGGSGEAHKIVLVSSGTMESSQDSRLMRDLGDALDEMGFAVVHDPENLGDFDADAARARAGLVDAAHAAVVIFEAGKERPGVLPGTHLWAVRATVHMVNERPEFAAPEPYTLEFVREDSSLTGIASDARDTWVNAFAPYIADAAVHSPQLTAVLNGEGETRALLAVTDLKNYEDLIRSRHETATEYAAYCQAEGERLQSFADAEGITCYGNPCGQYAMVGVNADNRPIVQDLSRLPIFTVPPKRKGYWAEPPERLFVIEADRSERDLLRSGNFYGIGTVNQGHAVGAVETFTSEGTSALWGFDTRDGSKKQMVLLGPGQRNGVSDISPDGAFALWCLRDGGMCHVQAGGAPTELPALSWGRFGWAGSELRIIGADRDGGVLLVDPTSGKASPVKAKGRFRAVAGKTDAGLVFVTRDDRGACHLVTADATGKVLADEAMPQCIDDPTLVADGRLVGTAVVTHPDDVPGDAEVVVWEPGMTAPFPLTSGAYREEIVYPSADGKTVFFNRRMDAPTDPRFDTRVYRRAVCEVELPEK